MSRTASGAGWGKATGAIPFAERAAVAAASFRAASIAEAASAIASAPCAPAGPTHASAVAGPSEGPTH
eukprot:2995097-Pyramimonas_sp.AAC.1